MDKIQVVYCEPGKLARMEEIGTDIASLQKAVDGLIETYYPFEEEVCCVVNDEGKINGMSPNRAVYGEDGKIMDVLFGPFFICDCSGCEFSSLSEEQQKRYLEKFKYPERFYRLPGNGIMAQPYTPVQEKTR